MDVNSELASIRATMQARFDRAEQDRREQREEAKDDRQAIKDTFERYARRCDESRDALALRCDDHDAILSDHQTVIDKVDGAAKATAWLAAKIVACVGGVTGFIEWLAHKR